MRRFYLLGIILLSNMACAQPVNIPQNSTSGAILQHNRQPWANPQPSNTPGKMAAPSNAAPEREITPEMEPVELEQKPLTPPIEEPLRIWIQEIEVKGVSLLPVGKVEKMIQPYRNRNLTFSEIQELSDALTALYVQAGYVNSQIYIPVQNFEGGQLILNAVEARVGQVLFEKKRWFSRRAIIPQIALKPGEPLNFRPLSQSIRMINDNPDVAIQARLQKGQLPGTTDVILQSQDHFPIHLIPFGDNLGRKNIGNTRYGVTINDNNLSGFGDTNSTSVNLSRSSVGLTNQYSLPISSHGMQLGFNYAYSRVKLGGDFAPLDIVSSAQIYTPSIRQVLWRSERAGLTSELGFDFMNLNTNLLGVPFYRDRLRVMRPQLEAFFYDRSGRFYLNQEFGIGIDVLRGTTGNQALASKPGSGTRFFRMTGGLTRVQKLPFQSTGILRFRYQYSPDRLISAQQFQVGGAFTVRGYPEGFQLGDKGYTLSGEWYVPAFFIPAKVTLPRMHEPLRQAIRLVGFYDFGQAFTNHATGGEFAKTILASTGFGLRIQLTRFLVGRIDLGFPLIRQQPYDQNRPRLHFGLQSTLF